MNILVKTPLNDEFYITVHDNDILLEENISDLEKLIASHINQEFHLESKDRSDFIQYDIIELGYSRKVLAKNILRDKGIDIHPKSLLTHTSEIIKLLIETEEIDIHAKDDEALINAVWHGHLEVVKVLLKYKANVHAKNDGALRHASTNGHLEIVKLVLAHGADVHAKDDYALRYSSWNGHLGIVKLLLANGADVHAMNDEALRCASRAGHSAIIKLLLDHGADVHANNDEALRYASNNGRLEIVKLLLAHTNSNESLVRIIHRGYQQAIKVLKKYIM